MVAVTTALAGYKRKSPQRWISASGSVRPLSWIQSSLRALKSTDTMDARQRACVRASNRTNADNPMTVSN